MNGVTAQTTRLTADLRHRIRQAIDARVRELEFDDTTPRCSRCGCDADLRTAGCRTCTNRHLRWKWRSSEAYREREREHDRARKQRRKAAA